MTRWALLNADMGQMALGPIRAAWEVTAASYQATGRTANWLAGRGVPLVVDGGHVFHGGTGLTTRTFHYRARLSDITSTLGIMLTANIACFDGTTAWPATINGLTHTISNTPTVVKIPALNLAGNAEGALEVEITWVAKSTLSVYVSSVQVFECPVIRLDTVGVEAIDSRSLIYDGYDNRESIAGLQRAIEELRTSYFRRGALFNWATGYPDGENTVETAYQALHSDGVKPAIQTRLMYNGETVRDVKCNVYARVSGGTGNVRITMASGDVVTFNITSTSNTWGTTQDLEIETDEPSAWDSARGVRGATRDNVNIEYRAGAGQTIYLLGVSIWDAPGD